MQGFKNKFSPFNPGHSHLCLPTQHCFCNFLVHPARTADTTSSDNCTLDHSAYSEKNTRVMPYVVLFVRSAHGRKHCLSATDVPCAVRCSQSKVARKRCIWAEITKPSRGYSTDLTWPQNRYFIFCTDHAVECVHLDSPTSACDDSRDALWHTRSTTCTFVQYLNDFDNE